MYKRLLFLKYRTEGCLNKEISNRLSVCTKTLTNWTNIFQEKGFDGLLSLKYEGRRVSEFEKYKTDIVNYIEKESTKTMDQLLKYLKDIHEVKTNYDNLYKFCKKNSIFLSKKQN